MFPVLALLSALLARVASDYLRINPYQEECILELAPLGAKIRFYFEVVEGGFLDINVAITGPDNRVFIQVDRESSGNYTFAAYMDGSYKFCFSNKMSVTMEKIVMVTIDISKAPERKDKKTATTAASPTAAGVLNSTGAGIAAGSTAASMMSVSTTTSGKGASESLVDLLQSIGAAGLSVATSVAGAAGEALLDGLSSIFQ